MGKIKEVVVVRKRLIKVIMLRGKLTWRISEGFQWRDFLVCVCVRERERERGVINEVSWAFI